MISTSLSSSSSPATSSSSSAQSERSGGAGAAAERCRHPSTSLHPPVEKPRGVISVLPLRTESSQCFGAMSSSHGLLNTVFSSCSSPVSKSISKRRLRATRSLDPAIIRHYGTDEAPAPDPEGFKACGRSIHPPPSPSSPSTPVETSTWSQFQFEEDWRGVRRSAGWDGPLVARSPSISPTGNFFSPRKWLQKKVQQATCHAYVVWRSEGDFTWNSLSGRSVRLKPVAIQSLSELERVRLQEVAYNRLHQDYDLGCQITIPKDGQKRKKSLRRKLDSLAKEKNKDKENAPQAFAISLSQVIANDRTYRQRQDGQRLDPPSREEHKDSSDLVSSILQFATKRATKELSSSNSSLSSTSETANESTSPNTPEAAPRTRRRGGMSVDSITDLDDNQSRLLEALQLSLPAETPSKKEKHRDKRLSLNPIYRQVPRLVDSCCQHLEKYGLQTVGIFRVGSSKKRVRQLREEFDRGVDVQLDEEHSIHDVAALLKEFLRDMPDPLLTKELYTAFINTMLMEPEDQQIATQLLVYLLPPCNSDTLHRLLEFLHTVAQHANDGCDKDGQEVTGNKMTSINLATIFGPNLLHKQKSSDKEFSVQSSARAEESTAVIAVVQRMIATFEDLFMVSPDLQNEVLMSLLETDPDVVDYLLRRKASQSPDLLNSETSFSLSERRSSSDSNKVSSGEVSPYDNNSPVMSERRGGEGGSSGTGPGGALSTERLFRVPEQYTLVGQVTGRTRHEPDTVSSPCSPTKGSYGNMSEGSSRSSQEGINSHQSDSKQLVRIQPSMGVIDCRQHAVVTRVGSSPQSGQRPLLLNLNLDSQSASSSSEDLPVGSTHSTPSPTVFPKPANRNDARPPPPPYGHSRSAASTVSSISNMPQTPVASAQQCPQQTGKALAQNSSSSSGGALTPLCPEWQDWQRDRWQIWQLLSSDNADTLPETLV